MRESLFIGLCLSLLLGVTSCKNVSSNEPYDESLDDLVKGIYFGMERKDFFDHCWDMNQAGDTHHGTIANMVMYIDSINYDPKTVINFYPKFEKDLISELNMIYYYHAWAPWNKNELKQDSLQMEVVRYFENRYETSFEKKEARPGYDVYYSHVNPLLIRVYKDRDEMLVKADIIHSGYQAKEK